MRVKVGGQEKTRARQAEARHLGGCRMAVSVRGFQPLEVDEPVFSGGTDTAPTPLEYVTAGLAACQAVSIAKVAEAMRFVFDGLEVAVDADVGYRATESDLAKVPRFTAVRLLVRLKTSEAEGRLARLKALVEDRCPASNLFRDAGIEPEVVWSISETAPTNGSDAP